MSELAAQTTHDIESDGNLVTKRYRSWQHDEPQREQTALRLLARYAPGLSPEFIAAGEAEGRPYLVMSRLPGELAGGVLSEQRLRQLAAALTRLHRSVPAVELARLPQRRWWRQEAAGALLSADWAPAAGQDEAVLAACAAARSWLGSTQFREFTAARPGRVFAQADGNLANALFDAEGCRLVDFEDSGWSDEAFELADLIEHPTCWLSGMLDPARFLEFCALDPATTVQLAIDRKAMAVFWLNLLLPGNPAHHRNPPGSLKRQAVHVAELLSERPARGA